MRRSYAPQITLRLEYKERVNRESELQCSPFLLDYLIPVSSIQLDTKMKLVLLLAAMTVLVKAQDSADVALDGLTEKPTPMVRDLPADVLRDFIGLCFASTLCRVFEVGQSWELTPFCGSATCVLSAEGYLIERVNDCGILPKPNPQCRIINEDARNETYPNCCPVFQCEKGVKLEYPTKEELQATLTTPSKVAPTPGSAIAQ